MSNPSTSTEDKHSSSQRLQRVMAAAGIGSRRECELIILEGRVEVDGQIVATLGAKVDPETQKIFVDGQRIVMQRLEYYMLNKPPGVLSTSNDPSGRARVIDLIKSNQRVYNVGRLDQSSEGLILVTNDGELANRLTHPKYGIEKKYHVKVDGVPTPLEIKSLVDGVYIAEGKAKAESARLLRKTESSSWLEIVLSEGKNREIRRILAKLGHKVRVLKRVAIGPLKMADLPVGAHRRLTIQEIKMLKRAADRLVPTKPGKSKTFKAKGSVKKPVRRESVSGSPRHESATDSPRAKSRSNSPRRESVSGIERKTGTERKTETERKTGIERKSGSERKTGFERKTGPGSSRRESAAGAPRREPGSDSPRRESESGTSRRASSAGFARKSGPGSSRRDSAGGAPRRDSAGGFVRKSGRGSSRRDSTSETPRRDLFPGAPRRDLFPGESGSDSPRRESRSGTSRHDAASGTERKSGFARKSGPGSSRRESAGGAPRRESGSDSPRRESAGGFERKSSGGAPRRDTFPGASRRESGSDSPRRESAGGFERKTGPGSSRRESSGGAPGRETGSDSPRRETGSGTSRRNSAAAAKRKSGTTHARRARALDYQGKTMPGSDKARPKQRGGRIGGPVQISQLIKPKTAPRTGKSTEGTADGQTKSRSPFKSSSSRSERPRSERPKPGSKKKLRRR